MKILYLLKRDRDKTLDEFLKAHAESHDVTVIDIRDDKDYEKIVEFIAISDKVISW
jgi:hypothetical protein